MVEIKSRFRLLPTTGFVRRESPSVAPAPAALMLSVTKLFVLSPPRPHFTWLVSWVGQCRVHRAREAMRAATA